MVPRGRSCFRIMATPFGSATSGCARSRCMMRDEPAREAEVAFQARHCETACLRVARVSGSREQARRKRCLHLGNRDPFSEAVYPMAIVEPKDLAQLVLDARVHLRWGLRP